MGRGFGGLHGKAFPEDGDGNGVYYMRFRDHDLGISKAAFPGGPFRGRIRLYLPQMPENPMQDQKRIQNPLEPLPSEMEVSSKGSVSSESCKSSGRLGTSGSGSNHIVVIAAAAVVVVLAVRVSCRRSRQQQQRPLNIVDFHFLYFRQGGRGRVDQGECFGCG